MPVYFIRAKGTDFVKIGWTSDVEKRLAHLQAGHWCELAVIRIAEGTPKTERHFHHMFRDQRVRGEWFRFHLHMLTAEPAEMEAPIIAARRDEGRDFKSLLTRGDQMKIAYALGISPASVCMWTKVPAERVPAVEAATGIPRHQLRPDLYREAA